MLAKDSQETAEAAESLNKDTRGRQNKGTNICNAYFDSADIFRRTVNSNYLSKCRAEDLKQPNISLISGHFTHTESPYGGGAPSDRNEVLSK